MRVLFAIIAFLPTLAFAADANKAHEHTGIIAPIKAAPPVTTLTRPELIKLRKGEAVLKQHQDGEVGGRGVAIFRVNATPDKVMDVIVDYSNYKNWIDKIVTSDVYAGPKDMIYVHFITKAVGISVEWYVEHKVNRAEHWLTWTLDYSRNSDLDDSVGYWRVTPVKGQSNMSQVEYSVDIRLKGWVPGFIKKLLVNQGLEEATSWVKVQAEAR